jgi:hypothetical protein
MRLFEEKMKLMKRSTKFRKGSSSLVPQKIRGRAGPKNPKVGSSTVSMRQEFEDSAAAFTLRARFRVQTTKKLLTRRTASRRAFRVDAGVERRESAKKQVYTRGEERLLLTSPLNAACERPECQEPIGGALCLYLLASGE